MSVLAALSKACLGALFRRLRFQPFSLVLGMFVAAYGLFPLARAAAPAAAGVPMSCAQAAAQGEAEWAVAIADDEGILFQGIVQIDPDGNAYVAGETELIASTYTVALGGNTIVIGNFTFESDAELRFQGTVDADANGPRCVKCCVLLDLTRLSTACLLV